MPGPAPTVRLVRSAAKRDAGIMLWIAEPSPGLEQIELNCIFWKWAGYCFCFFMPRLEM